MSGGRRAALFRAVLLLAAGCVLAACAGPSSHSGAPASTAGPHVHASGPVSPQPEINGAPVLVTPGPARAAYLESQRQKLPWVEHPPSRVAIAGTVVSANARGMLVNIPPVPTSPQDSGIVFHPVPSEAVPGSDVRVDFVSASDFLLAHGQQSLAPGSPILVMGINRGSAIRAVLVTDGSGVHHPESLDVTASALKRTGWPRVLGGSAQLDATRTATAGSGTSPELVGHGSVGLDGINVGINNIGFGNQGSDCPYFRFNATVTAGYGAQWNFHMHFALDTSGNLTVVSDPASGSAVSINNTVNHTYYSAFGGGVQWGVDLGCDTPIPIPQFESLRPQPRGWARRPRFLIWQYLVGTSRERDGPAGASLGGQGAQCARHLMYRRALVRQHPRNRSVFIDDPRPGDHRPHL